MGEYSIRLRQWSLSDTNSLRWLVSHVDCRYVDDMLPQYLEEWQAEKIVKDFVDAVRGETKPAIDVYTACEWTAVGLLSGISVTNNGYPMEVPHFRPRMPLEEKRITL